MYAKQKKTEQKLCNHTINQIRKVFDNNLGVIFKVFPLTINRVSTRLMKNP